MCVCVRICLREKYFRPVGLGGPNLKCRILFHYFLPLSLDPENPSQRAFCLTDPEPLLCSSLNSSRPPSFFLSSLPPLSLSLNLKRTLMPNSWNRSSKRPPERPHTNTHIHIHSCYVAIAAESPDSLVL